MRKNLIVAAATTLLFTLTACAGGEEAAGDDHNDADVTFAQQMIPHHQQAVEMADLAATRAESQEVKDLASDIKAAQGPEIETMTGWLEDWDEEVPDADMSDMSGMDHGGMDMSSDGSSGMTGMMSEEDMTALEAASGADFDQMFLTMMIEHHQGAIEMAQTEQTEGEFDAAVELAEEIESAQTAEIAAMQDLLAS